MCCTIHIEPPKPATCSANLCTELPGFCPANDDDESADNWVKKDLIPYPGGEYGDNVPSFEKRGKKQTYTLVIDQLTITIIAAAYPSLTQLFGPRYAAQALRSWFRLMTGACVGPTITRGSFFGSSVPSKPQLRDLQAEHVIDRQVLKSFFETIITGNLPSGRPFGLPGYSVREIQSKLHSPNPALAARPPVGSGGIQPDTINGRLSEAFGSNNNPYPFMAVDAKVNGPKGRIMAGNAAAGIRRIRRLARRAVAADTNAAADTLLSAIRSVGPQLWILTNHCHSRRARASRSLTTFANQRQHCAGTLCVMKAEGRSAISRQMPDFLSSVIGGRHGRPTSSLSVNNKRRTGRERLSRKLDGRMSRRGTMDATLRRTRRS